jgi:mono/diheme cytochrome c family protein
VRRGILSGTLSTKRPPPISFAECAMRRAAILAGGAALALAVLGIVRPPGPRAADNPKAAEAGAALVKRGDYLVNEVARCGDCHTPRDDRGNLDRTRHLQGASIWFTPKVKPREWEGHAPDITAGGKAGKWGEAKMVKYLMNGGNDEDEGSDPPMPAYRLSEDDARAVTAYLRSLPGGKQGAGRKKKDDDD